MVNKIKSGVLSLLLFASLSCSKDDGIRTDEGPQLQSMIVSLFKERIGQTDVRLDNVDCFKKECNCVKTKSMPALANLL